MIKDPRIVINGENHSFILSLVLKMERGTISVDLAGMCYSVAAHRNLADAGSTLGTIQHEASFYAQWP